jgi:hypothetical protein
MRFSSVPISFEKERNTTLRFIHHSIEAKSGLWEGRQERQFCNQSVLCFTMFYVFQNCFRRQKQN